HPGAKLVIAPSGTLKGPSEQWWVRFNAEETASENRVIFVGRQEPGTLGHQLLQSPGLTSVPISGKAGPARMRTSIIRYFGHADAQNVLAALKRAYPKNVLAVHGSVGELTGFIREARRRRVAQNRIIAPEPEQQIVLDR